MVTIVRPREPGNTRISTTGGSGDADGSLVSGLVAAGYGRARLWLGMSAVGTIVILSTVALALGLILRLREVGDSLLDKNGAPVYLAFWATR